MNAQKNLTPSDGQNASSGLLESAGLPDSVAARFRQHALAGENIVAWFQTDLDQNLRYEPGYVLLTDRRLISFTGSKSANGFADWPIGPAFTLQAHEHAGLGS